MTKSLEISLFCKELEPDVLVVTEQRFNDRNVELFEINNYCMGNSFQRNNNKGSGVFVKKIFDSLRVEHSKLFIFLNYCKLFSFME